MYATPIAFKDHFSDRASTYASYRPTYSGELIDFLASVAPARNAAWDCGCGSGQMSLPLAEKFDRVIATDASAEQIEHATPHPRVEYRHAPAERSGLADASVDLIVAAQAAHWFDLPAFYDEVRRVARPTGVVALVTYNLINVNEPIDRLVRDFYASLPWPPERKMVEDGYASIAFPFRELRAPQIFMHGNWTADEMIGYVRTWSALRNLDASAFERDLRNAWGENKVRAVRWPVGMRIGRVE